MSVRRHRRENKTAMVVVDYVQLLRERGKDPRERIDSAMHQLVALARSEGLTLVVVSQLNRENEKDKRRPRLSDLKESGSIEETADLVLLVHRSETDNGLIVAKNKNGRTGWIPLHWDGPTASWRDAERQRSSHWNDTTEREAEAF